MQHKILKLGFCRLIQGSGSASHHRMITPTARGSRKGMLFLPLFFLSLSVASLARQTPSHPRASTLRILLYGPHTLPRHMPPNISERGVAQSLSPPQPNLAKTRAILFRHPNSQNGLHDSEAVLCDVQLPPLTLLVTSETKSTIP